MCLKLVESSLNGLAQMLKYGAQNCRNACAPTRSPTSPNSSFKSCNLGDIIDSWGRARRPPPVPANIIFKPGLISLYKTTCVVHCHSPLLCCAFLFKFAQLYTMKSQVGKPVTKLMLQHLFGDVVQSRKQCLYEKNEVQTHRFFFFQYICITISF